MGSIVSCASNLLYLGEKLSLTLTCTGLICCLVLFFSVTLGMGVGLGYNYCYVDMKTKYKYIKGHYIYPGSPRWPHRREANAMDEAEHAEIVEDEALRTLKIPDEVKIRDQAAKEQLYRDTPHFNNTKRHEAAMGYHPTFSDLEAFNGTESSVETTVDATTNDNITAISESSTKTRNSLSTILLKSSSTTTTTEGKTEIMDETNELTPKPAIINNPTSRKVKKLVIPISGLDLISLLSQLRAENRNYSLQVVTT